MANIRNSISLTDRMTPTLRSILKAMDSTLRVMKNLDRASNNGAQSKAYKRAEKDIKRANNELIKMGNYNKLVARSAGDGERAYRRMGSAVSGAANNMRSLGSSASMFLHSLAHGVYLAQKLASGVSGIMNTADAARSQVARLGLYNTSEYSNEALYGQVFRTALNTRSGLTETADLVNKILISGVYSGDNAVQSAIGTAGIINKALVAGGGTAEENQRAIRQLTQGLASGVLQGDELRSIREQVPYFAEVLAQGLAKVDERFEGIGIGDLKRLGSEGELTADRVVKAMWAMQDEINQDFEAMPKTFGQAMTSLSSIWKYFLWMLSDTEGPLGRINDKLWQMVDYLQTPEGFELLNAVAQGIDILSWAITSVLDGIGQFIVFLQENSSVAIAIFAALGAVAVVAGVMAMTAWLAAVWPILLMGVLIGIIVYKLLEAGYTISEIVGAVAGVILAAIAIIWDLILYAIMFIIELIAAVLTVIVGVGAGAILIVMGVVQVIIWAAMVVTAIFWGLLTVIETVFLLGKAAVEGFVIGVVGLFYGLAMGVLGIMNLIAQGIDAVFGSNLADAVSGWSSTLEGNFTAFVQENDPSKTIEEIGEIWQGYAAGVEDMFTSDEYNLYGEMGNVIDGTGTVMNGIWDTVGTAEDFLSGYVVNPADAYAAGNEWGIGLVDGIGDFNLGLPDDSVFGPAGGDGVTVDGGYLDGIKSDVNISDEDVKLLRDMAARDYLLQLQSITPVAHVTFGDVRETADVGKIVEVIEQMVDEQMATALVG